MNITFIHPDLAAVLSRYTLILDVLGNNVKERGYTYLPNPNSDIEQRKFNANSTLRYDNVYLAYKQRAVFYPITRRTLQGLAGQVFNRDPIIDIPSYLEDLKESVDGQVSLLQAVKKLFYFTFALSRAGAYVDYQGEGDKGRPTIHIVDPRFVINWRTAVIDGKKMLTKVIVCEPYVSSDDGYELVESAQYREMYINSSGFYEVRIIREKSPTKWDKLALPRNKAFNNVGATTAVPTDFSGSPFTELPFTFVGGLNNDEQVDFPLFYDISSINIAHYVNSAEYEDMVYLVGQPTPWASGLTQQWVDTNFKDKTINFGSRAFLPLPVNGQAGLLQVTESAMSLEAMQHKERIMASLGARMIEQRDVQRTATESSGDRVAETSILADVANNVSDAVEWLLRKASQFVTKESPTTAVVYRLNTDYDVSKLQPEQRAAVVREWQAGALSFKEMRELLRAAGVATEEDAVVMAEVEKAKDAEVERQKSLKVTNKGVDNNA